MIPNPPKIIVISGPTASGKTSLGIELAQRLGGEIVSADSMQVYRFMDIGTAKVSARKRAIVPHYLIDVADPDDEFNAARYGRMADHVIDEIWKRGKPIFLVGGTGLYIKTLLGGLLKGPGSSPDLREALNRRWRVEGAESLYEQLKKLDADAAARIHPRDRIRIIRALELMGLTKRRYTDLTGEHGFRDKKYEALKVAIGVERENLYQRINHRTVEMIENGLVKETEDLLNRGYGSDLKSMKALGYRHAVNYLKGEWDIDQMIYFLQRDTRHYAKRQLTWFRGDRETIWIARDQALLLEEMILHFLAGPRGSI